MKAANLLISNNGNLKVADFGLARSFDPNVSRTGLDSRGRERRYTNCVVTRWYRPPELLLGARHYGGEVDMWGIGCVLGEMFSRRPILPGTSDLDQLEKIWQLCGTPNQHSWPNFDALPGCEGVKRFSPYLRRIKPAYESVGPETCDLLDRLLICNPRDRITAAQALDHEYFWTDPLPADPKTYVFSLARFAPSTEINAACLLTNLLMNLISVGTVINIHFLDPPSLLTYHPPTPPHLMDIHPTITIHIRHPHTTCHTARIALPLYLVVLLVAPCHTTTIPLGLADRRLGMEDHLARGEAREGLLGFHPRVEVRRHACRPIYRLSLICLWGGMTEIETENGIGTLRTKTRIEKETRIELGEDEIGMEGRWTGTDMRMMLVES